MPQGITTLSPVHWGVISALEALLYIWNKIAISQFQSDAFGEKRGKTPPLTLIEILKAILFRIVKKSYSYATLSICDFKLTVIANTSECDCL